MQFHVSEALETGLPWSPCAGTSPNCIDLEPPATTVEVEAAARQYVRKVSGITRPSEANGRAFEAAVAEVAGHHRALVRRPATAPSAAPDWFRRCAGPRVLARLNNQ